MKKLPLFRFCLILIFTWIAGTLTGLDAQVLSEDEDEEYRRFSVSVYGGITLDHDGSGLKLLGSNFNRVTDHSYNIGGGVQYAITPFWSAGAEYRFITIDGGTLFETDVHSATLKNYFNFNRLYRRFGISEYLNPFITLGIGRDFFTYASEDIRRTGNEIHFSTGFGLAANITETIEVFGQYDLQMGSNALDNIRAGFPADLLGMASGGVRIYLGSRDKRRMSMAPPSVTLTEAEYDEFRQRRHRLLAIEDRTRAKDEEIASLREELSELDKKFDNNLEELYAAFDQFSGRFSRFEEELAALRLQIENTRIIRDELPAGHYIQVFATTTEKKAQDIRRLVIMMLNNSIDNPQEKVTITHRLGFYEVRIGEFRDLTIAENIHRVAIEEFEDAFIITFARPFNLRDAYRDIRVIR